MGSGWDFLTWDQELQSRRPPRLSIRELGAALPLPRTGGDPCPHERRALGPGTDSPAGTWVLRPTLSPGRESPVRGLPSALSSASLPREPPGPWGPLREQAGWGVSLQSRAPPAPPHLTEAEQSGEGGGHASPPCDPGHDDGGDVGALRTDRPQGVSSPGLGLPVTGLSHQRPRRKGNSLFLKAWRHPHDSPSVFLRHPVQLRASRAWPSL